MGFGTGGLATGIFTTVPGLVLLYYMTDTLGVAAGLAGLVVVVPKLLDLVVNHSSVGSGQVKLNSNADLAGAIFVQRGDFEFNGTATFTGTLVSNTIGKWNGNATSQLTDCFLDNLPPGAMEVTRCIHQ